MKFPSSLKDIDNEISKLNDEYIVLKRYKE